MEMEINIIRGKVKIRVGETQYQEYRELFENILDIEGIEVNEENIKKLVREMYEETLTNLDYKLDKIGGEYIPDKENY